MKIIIIFDIIVLEINSMKNIERGSIKYLIISTIAIIIAGIILYPILDLLYRTV